MHWIGRNKTYSAIYASVEREIGIERRYVPVMAVVHTDFHHIPFSELQKSCDIRIECRVASGMVSGKAAVHIDFGDLIHSAEMQDYCAVFPGVVRIE